MINWTKNNLDLKMPACISSVRGSTLEIWTNAVVTSDKVNDCHKMEATTTNQPIEEDIEEDEEADEQEKRELSPAQRLDAALSMDKRASGAKKKGAEKKPAGKKNSIVVGKKAGAAKPKKPVKKSDKSVAEDVANTKNESALLVDTILESTEEEPSTGVVAKTEGVDEAVLAAEAQNVIEEEDEEIIEADLDINEIIHRTNAQDPYIKACKTLGIAPVSYIVTHIDSHELIMRHHGLGARGAQALAQIMEYNTSIAKLDLSNNAIEFGGKHLSQSLALNTTVTYFNLSDNKLGILE
jgi:hypothetical protein